MFGKNEVTAPFRNEQGDLKVVELFYTIQGEGPDQGRPAIFLRLAHCNLRCFFCDTQFDKGTDFDFATILQDVLTMSRVNRCSLLVITGGEPLLQNIAPLVRAVNEHGLAVSIETAGTVWYPELDELFSPLRAINQNLVVCSPKTPKVNERLERLVGAWKYIIIAGETGIGGIPDRSTQKPGDRASIFMPDDVTVPIYVQACDQYDDEKNKLNFAEATRIALKYGYRLGVQIHKLAGLR